MGPKISSYFVLINLILVQFLMLIKGDYILRVQVRGYSNPTNTCAECIEGDNQEMGCCDDFDDFNCQGDERCDNEFFYCLMPLETVPLTDTVLDSVVQDSLTVRAEQLGCLQPSTALRSTVINNDGASINFLSGRVLGLPNPLEFEVTAVRWQGITLYVDVIDNDDDLENNNPDELVDVFPVDLQPADLVAGGMVLERTYSGTFGRAFIELSFQLECLSGFIGEDCLGICDSIPCNNSGICEAGGTSGFTCTCRGDFTGDTCDVTIDDCLNVNCNNGTCVDGVRSFICECEVGYTGQFCEERVTITTNSELSSPSSSSNVGLVAGAVAGSVVFVMLIIIAVMALSLLLAKRRANSVPKAYAGTQSSGTTNSDTMDNPMYDITRIPTGEEVGRDLDNPVYGLPDHDSTSGMITDSGHFDVVYSSIDT